MTRFDEWTYTQRFIPVTPATLPALRACWRQALREAAKLACQRCCDGQPLAVDDDGDYYHTHGHKGRCDRCRAEDIYREIELMRRHER